jgi:hypothetical protein
MRGFMEVYSVLARCKATLNCLGRPHFGFTYAEDLHVLTDHLRNFAPQPAVCPICQKEARYSFVDYFAERLDSLDEQADARSK